MSRLTLDAVASKISVDGPNILLSAVLSVSRADTGDPLTGLTSQDFRITNFGSDGPILNPDHLAISVSERQWVPDQSDAGVYDVEIKYSVVQFFGPSPVGIQLPKGARYTLCMQIKKLLPTAAKPQRGGGAPMIGLLQLTGQALVSFVVS